MKKKFIILIIVALLLISGLIGAIIFINSYDKKEVVDETMLITNCKSKDVKSIDVKSDDDEFSLSFYNIKKKDVLRIDGYENIPSTESLFENILKNVTALKAEKNFGSVDDFKDYGFDNPYATFTLHLKKGDDITVIFGNESPDGSGIYAKRKSDNTIYLVKKSVADLFTQKKENFFSRNLFSYSNTEVLNVKKIELTGKNKDEVTVEPFGDDTSAHLFKITNPKECFADDEKVAEILYFLTLSSSAKDIEKINADANDFEKYGFNNPQSKIIFTFDDAVEEISFVKSKEDKNILFAKINNIPVIYALSKDDFKAYDYTFKDLESSKLFSANINFLDTLTVSFDNKDYKIKVDAENKSATCNEKEIDYPEFASYYASFLSINKIADDDVKGEKILTINLTFKGNRADSKIEYIKDSDNNYGCFIDGEYKGLVDLSKFMDGTNHFTESIKD
jgi:hypothetical protein